MRRLSRNSVAFLLPGGREGGLRHGSATIRREAVRAGSARAAAHFRRFRMSKIVRGALAAALLVAVAACSTTPPAGDPGAAPARKLDAKTQLECGNKRGCR
jgi:hypothetical protein